MIENLLTQNWIGFLTETDHSNILLKLVTIKIPITN